MSKKNEDQSSTGTALATLADRGYAVAQYDPAGILDIVRENMGGTLTPADLCRIKMPGGGAKAFEVPDENGEVQSVKTIAGVVLLAKTQRAYWDQPFGGGNEPPTCASLDGLTGMGSPGGPCDACPLNQFGTDERERGKACKEMKLLFLLRPSLLLPDVVVLPPSSLASWRKYATLLTSRAVPIAAVVTEVALEEKANVDGIKYSMARFKVVERLAPESAAHLREYAAGMAQVFTAVAAAPVARGDVDGPKD